MLAANGIDSAMLILAGSLISIFARMGMITVTIIAVVAVLLINAERKAVTAIRPNMIIFGLVPNGFSRIRVMFLSKLYLTAASARTNPPRKRMIIGLANVPTNWLNGTGS